MLRIIDSRDTGAVDALLRATRHRDRRTDVRVRQIVEAVRRGGDAALQRYARQLDDLQGPIEVPRTRWVAEASRVSPDVRRAIATAAEHLRTVARAQVPRPVRVSPARGLSVEQRVLPLARVGCYVPAGRYPLPSSLLMTVIPARMAGVGEICVACPRPDATVYAAALEAGVDRLFQVGGAHAVAALAFGTDSIPRVDKIVGPGNRWVSAAKALVASECGIDFYAGPSEIITVVRETPAAWVAADLIAQAEHDPDARAIAITTRRRLATQIAREVTRQLPPRGIARVALQQHGGVIVCRSMREAMVLVNAAAAEHLVVEDEGTAAQVTSAGAIFVGPWTAQVAGDYALGSNHVLPTSGAARFRGGLSAADFVRLVTVQRASRAALKRLAPTVTTLARAEGLEGHALSIDARVPQRRRA